MGDRFAAASGFCIQCPEGCDLCNSNYECSLCLSGYALSGTVCVLECEIDNSCGTTPTDSIIPLPGCLSAIVWLVIVLILKFAAI